MRFQNKNKILKSYGVGLVERTFSSAKAYVERNPGSALLKGIEISLNSKIEDLEKEHGEKDRKIIIESMADALLEQGAVSPAYELYKKSNIRKANIIKKTLPYEL